MSILQDFSPEWLADYYARAILRWDEEVDGRKRGCRRRARRLVLLWTRACQRADIIPSKDVEAKARELIAFGCDDMVY